MADANTKEPTKQRIPPLEWVVAAIGAALLLAIVVFLGREVARDAERPPDIVVATDSVVAGRGGWLVRVRARNLGDASAAAVGFRGTLARPGGEPVVRDVQLDYLPGHSERELSFVFPVDPRRGALTIEVLGHQAP